MSNSRYVCFFLQRIHSEKRLCFSRSILKIRIAKLFQRSIMRGYCFPKRIVMVVRDIELICRFFNNFADFRVVNTAYFWEQVMFNLKI